jgi:hypothetical protein
MPSRSPCLQGHPRRCNNATRSANTPMAVSGPSPTRANLQSGCDLGTDTLATEVAMSGSGVVGWVALIGIVDIGGLLSHSRDGERRGHWCEASCRQQGVDSRRVDQPCRARVQSALTLAEALAQWWLRRAAVAPVPSPLRCRRCRRSRQRPTRTACMQNDRRTKHEARHWGCSRDRHSPCRHSVHTPECAHPRSRPRPIAEV